jgi:hypothetical protein
MGTKFCHNVNSLFWFISPLPSAHLNILVDALCMSLTMSEILLLLTQSLNDIFFLLKEIGVIESPTATFLSLIFLIEKAQHEIVRLEREWDTGIH